MILHRGRPAKNYPNKVALCSIIGVEAGSALVAGSDSSATTSYFSESRDKIVAAPCLLSSVKSPGTKPCFGTFIGRAIDAIDFDSVVYCLGKCLEFYHSGGLAGIVRQLVDFSCLLN